MSLVTVFLLLLFYNMLRIECVLIDRRLSRAFGADKRKLKDILSKRAIEIMCVEYKDFYRGHNSLCLRIFEQCQRSPF